MKYIYKPINNNIQYGNKRSLDSIKFIVVHDTGNKKKGAGAMSHYKYLAHATRSGSAHYYVDDVEIVQPIGDSLVAWAVGDTWAISNRTRADVTNSNSISVEICVNPDSNYKQAVTNTVELVKNLMKKFNIPIDNVVRHFDVSGKPCPNSMINNNWKLWNDFKNRLTTPILYNIDLEKNSTFGGDSTVSSWAVNWDRAVELGIVDGTEPKGIPTREQVIEMIFRSKGVL